MTIQIKTKDQNGNGYYLHEFATLQDAQQWLKLAQPYVSEIEHDENENPETESFEDETVEGEAPAHEEPTHEEPELGN